MLVWSLFLRDITFHLSGGCLSCGEEGEAAGVLDATFDNVIGRTNKHFEVQWRDERGVVVRLRRRDAPDRPRLLQPVRPPVQRLIRH